MATPDALAKVVRSLGMAEPRAVAGFADEPFWAVTVPGTDAIRCWQIIRDEADTSGYWPVIVGNFYGPEAGGSDAAIEAFAEAAQEIRSSPEPTHGFEYTRTTPAEILAAASELPFEAWVARQRDPGFQVDQNLRKAEYFDKFPGAEQLAKSHRRSADDWRSAPVLPFDPGAVRPPSVNKNPPQHELHCAKCFDSAQSRVVIAASVSILCVPAQHGWEALAHLFYDNTPHELPAQVHVAAFRWLHDQFGAELIGLQDRTLEALPRRKPRTWIEAVRAADQIGAYSHCPATSENELATTAELALFLMDSAYWSFCWP